MVLALEEQLVPVTTLVLRGPVQGLQAWQAELAREFLPGSLVLAVPDGLARLPPPLDKPPVGGPGAGPVNGWLCRGVTCLQPMGNLVDLRKALTEKSPMQENA